MYLMLDKNSLQIVFPFQNERYTNPTFIKVMGFIFEKLYIFFFQIGGSFLWGIQILALSLLISFPQDNREKVKEQYF